MRPRLYLVQLYAHIGIRTKFCRFQAINRPLNFFEAKVKNESSKLGAKFSFKRILKVSCENIEKSKSFRLLSRDDFSKIMNGDMGNFVHFWGIMALVSTFQ